MTHNCGVEYTVRISDEDWPVLECIGCQARVKIDEKLERKIISGVRRHLNGKDKD